MKKQSVCQKTGLLVFIMLTALSGYTQLEFTVTTTSTNISGYRAFIDVPALSGNPAAIIMATPLGNTAVLNPHPIGAYYNQSKWSIINLDQAGMSAGLTFKVQYFLQPGPNQFVHLITNQNTPTYNASYIDNPALNNNPTAKVSIFQNWAPSVRGGNYDRYESAAFYSTTAGKWYIANVGNQILENPSAYNVIITTTSATFTNPNANKDINSNAKTPISTDPTISNPNSGKDLNTKTPETPITNATAGGDLNGNYPNPKVIGLQGKPLSNNPPAVGQILKWNGTEWTPTTEPVATTVLPKSYYRSLTPDYTWAANSGYEAALPGMSIQITITMPSMVNVSMFAQTIVTTDCGLINNCGGQGTGINLYRDNTLLVKTLKGGSNESVTQVLPNYPELLNPGTYTYKVFGRKIYSNSNIKYLGASNPDESFKSYMSIQVFPQ